MYNGTLETLIWSKMLKILMFFWLEKLLILIIFPLFLICKKCTHVAVEEIKQF